VKITFKHKELEQLANNDKLRLKMMGKNRAVRFKLRLTQLYAADTLHDVKDLPGNYHELVGDLKGKWACDLDQPYRLIFTPHEDPIPTDPNGKYIWLEIHGVEILEIKDYH